MAIEELDVAGVELAVRAEASAGARRKCARERLTLPLTEHALGDGSDGRACRAHQVDACVRVLVRRVAEPLTRLKSGTRHRRRCGACSALARDREAGRVEWCRERHHGSDDGDANRGADRCDDEASAPR
jgi:hypothetical protein